MPAGARTGRAFGTTPAFGEECPAAIGFPRSRPAGQTQSGSAFSRYAAQNEYAGRLCRDAARHLPHRIQRHQSRARCGLPLPPDARRICVRLDTGGLRRGIPFPPDVGPSESLRSCLRRFRRAQPLMGHGLQNGFRPAAEDGVGTQGAGSARLGRYARHTRQSGATRRYGNMRCFGHHLPRRSRPCENRQLLVSAFVPPTRLGTDGLVPQPVIALRHVRISGICESGCAGESRLQPV